MAESRAKSKHFQAALDIYTHILETGTELSIHHMVEYTLCCFHRQQYEKFAENLKSIVYRFQSVEIISTEIKDISLLLEPASHVFCNVLPKSQLFEFTNLLASLLAKDKNWVSIAFKLIDFGIKPAEILKLYDPLDPLTTVIKAYYLTQHEHHGESLRLLKKNFDLSESPSIVWILAFTNQFHLGHDRTNLLKQGLARISKVDVKNGYKPPKYFDKLFDMMRLLIFVSFSTYQDDLAKLFTLFEARLNTSQKELWTIRAIFLHLSGKSQEAMVCAKKSLKMSFYSDHFAYYVLATIVSQAEIMSLEDTQSMFLNSVRLKKWAPAFEGLLSSVPPEKRASIVKWYHRTLNTFESNLFLKAEEGAPISELGRLLTKEYEQLESMPGRRAIIVFAKIIIEHNQTSIAVSYLSKHLPYFSFFDDFMLVLGESYLLMENWKRAVEILTAVRTLNRGLSQIEAAVEGAKEMLEQQQDEEDNEAYSESEDGNEDDTLETAPTFDQEMF